jgi:hypothetical protein
MRSIVPVIRSCLCLAEHRVWSPQTLWHMQQRAERRREPNTSDACSVVGSCHCRNVRCIRHRWRSLPHRSPCRRPRCPCIDSARSCRHHRVGRCDQEGPRVWLTSSCVRCPRPASRYLWRHGIGTVHETSVSTTRQPTSDLPRLPMLPPLTALLPVQTQTWLGHGRTFRTPLEPLDSILVIF